MSLCNICFCTPKHCRARSVALVTDAELDRHAFRYDVRVTLASLHVPGRQMLDFLADAYRDADCATVVDKRGAAVEIELDVLEFPSFPWWVRDLCRLPPEGVSTRLKAEKREAFRTLATLLRLLFPAESMFWGVRAANDN